MKTLITILFSSLFFSSIEWRTDFNKAQAQAVKENKPILINFSGSDWCGPCIRMEKEFFGSHAFANYAANHLLLVNADFPRLKKNQLSKEQMLKNESLAEKYNPEGQFPLTVLVNANGEVLKKWEGLPGETSDEFVDDLKSAFNARN